MKKINIIIIFLFACVLAILIYKRYEYREKNILVLGDNNLLNLDVENYIYYLKENYKNINDRFVSDYKKYIDIENDIKNNKYIYIKGKKMFLNQEIKNADIIIISANNDDYISKCNKNNNIINNYNSLKYKEVSSIINLTNKISASKVIILGNYCYKYNSIISNEQNELYSKYNYINLNELDANYNFEYKIYLEIKKYIDS